MTRVQAALAVEQRMTRRRIVNSSPRKRESRRTNERSRSLGPRTSQ